MTKTKYLTRTAILLALSLLFQSLRLIPALTAISQPIVGTLVNLTLIVAAGVVGIWSSIFVGICTPIVARLQGQLGQDLFIPVVALGNIVYGLVFYYLKKVNNILGVTVGSIAKFALLFFAMPFVFGTFIQSTLPEAQASKMLAAIISNFGNPIQLITAIIGGSLALIIIKTLKRKIPQ